MICKNIDIYFHEPECLEELETYIKDDWKDAFRVQPRIIDCYIPCEDIDLKAKYNEEYEGCCSVVNYRMVGEWGRQRHWYKRYTLASIGKKSNDFAHMYKHLVIFRCMLSALILSILPSVVFLASGLLSNDILLTVTALIFAPCHILISYKNACK